MQNLTKKLYPEYRKNPDKPIAMIAIIVAGHCPKHLRYINSFNLYYISMRQMFIMPILQVKK